MKPGKKRGGVSGDARKLAEEQRSLIAEIDQYLAKNDSLSGMSVEGLRKVESILLQDIRELEGKRRRVAAITEATRATSAA